MENKRDREAEILAHNANSIRKMSTKGIPEHCQMTPATVSKYKSGKGCQIRIQIDE